MIFQTANVSICNGNMKCLTETWTFFTKCAFKLINVFIAFAIWRSPKYHFSSLTTILTTSWRSFYTIGWSKIYATISAFRIITVNHSHISLASFSMRYLQVQQPNDVKVFNTNLPSFVISKIAFVWDVKPGSTLQ